VLGATKLLGGTRNILRGGHAEASGGAKARALLSLVLSLAAICAGRLSAYF
jgi:hypothetical protein